MANEFVARNGLIAQANSQITGSLIVSSGITADLTGTASYASNANLLDGVDSTQLVLTSSFNAYTASVNNNSGSFVTYTNFNANTASINNFSASILSYTSSLNSATSSFVKNNQTSSFVQNSQTSSFATFTALNAYTSSINNYTSSINSQTSSFATFTALNAYTSSINNFSASILSYTSSLNAATSSFVLNSQTSSFVQNSQTSSFATFTELNAYTSSINSYTSSLNSATSSFVRNSQTSSFVQSSQTSSFVQNSQTSSFVLNSQTSSMSVLSASYAATASFANNFTVANTLTAQTLVVQTVSSSVIYSSGSNVFGNSLANIQVLTGSVIVTGSLSVNGSNAVLVSQTSSLTPFTNFNSYTSSINSYTSSLNSATSSFVQNSQTSSFVQNSQTSSFATFTALNSYTSSINTYTSSLNSATGSFATFTALNAYTSSINTYTSSLNSKTSSFATTGSNTFNGNLIITGSVMIGSSSLGANENTITLGARDSVNEGGQIGFNAPGGTYTSASFIDNWSNYIRILRGSNATSDGLVTQWNLHTKQMQLPAYTSATSFVGTATANLAVDSGGNVITVSTSGGTVFPYTGNAVITGSLTATTGLIAPINGGMYLRGGDDAEFWDINVVNTVGIYGQQNADRAAIKLGSSGPTLFGSSSRFGIGTITPTQGTLEVNGNIYATSLTGSLLGTATSASNAISASQAANSTLLNGLASSAFALTANTASFATFTAFNFYTGSANAFSASMLSYTASQNNKNNTYATTGSNIFVGKQNISGSTYISGAIYQGVLGGTESTLEGYGVVVQGSSAKLRVGPNYSSGGDRDYVDIIADGTNSTLQTNNENFLINNQASGGNITLRTSGSGNINVTGSLNVTGSSRIIGSLGVGMAPSATAGRIDASNDIVAYSTSDIRFKENINPIPNALEKLDQIGGYTFDWKTEEELVSLHGFKGHDIGVIAQEIEAILPEVVTTRDSGYKAVKYEKIVPLLIQAIKEQQLQIKELQDIIKNK